MPQRIKSNHWADVLLDHFITPIICYHIEHGTELYANCVINGIYSQPRNSANIDKVRSPANSSLSYSLKMTLAPPHNMHLILNRQTVL